MNWKKGLIAISIFFVLLIGAWYIDGHVNRPYDFYYPSGEYDYQVDPKSGNVHIFEVDTEGNEIVIIKPFGPREYIRIVDRK